MLKIIAMPVPRRRSTDKAEGASGERKEAQILALRRGVPRTAPEWTALVKVASGERDIPASYYVRLVGLGLIERSAGFATLTRHGRITLGLPD